MPVNETEDEVHQCISCSHTMNNERDVLGWSKDYSGSLPSLVKLARNVFL